MGPIEILNIPLDPYIIALVLLAGLFQKKFLNNFLPRMSGQWKTLLTSIVFCSLYGVTVYQAGSFTKELPKAYLFSFIVATTLYNYLFKKYVAKLFGEDAVKLLIIVMIMPAILSCSSLNKAGHEDMVKQRAIENLTGRTNYQRASYDSALLRIRTDAETGFQTSVTRTVITAVLCYTLVLAAGAGFLFYYNKPSAS